MANETARSTAAPKKLDQVLAKVSVMLEATLAKMDARLEELDQLAQAKPNDRPARRLAALEQRLQRAGTVAEQMDPALAESEKSVRDYMSGVESLRQKLLDWIGKTGTQVKSYER